MPTKLPATIEETEALGYVQRMLAGPQRVPLMTGDEYDFSDSEESKRFCRDIMKSLVAMKPTYLMTVVDYARGGWALADEALREIILEHLNDGRPMPTYLAAYNMDIAANNLPRRKPAQRRETNLLRDIRIAIAVLLVVERFNIRPTRNPTTQKRPSACAIVAKALNMSEPAVVAIWQRVSKSF